jgi:YVTN family beta-propeller protein
VVADESRQQIYTLNGDGTISILNSANGQIKTNLFIGDHLRFALVSTNTHRVFITSDEGLTVLDSAGNSVITNVVTGSKPAGIAIDESANRIYVANQLSGRIAVLDSETYEIVASWQPVRSNVWALSLDPTSHLLYVTVPPPTLGAFNGLEILDSTTGTFLGEIPTGGSVVSDRSAGLVVVNRQSHRAYVTEPDNNSVYVVQGTNLFTTVTVGNLPHGLSLDENRGLVYVGNALDGTLSVLREADLFGFQITGAFWQDDGLTVFWNSRSGDIYQVQYKDRLSDSLWTNLGPPLTANSSVTSIKDFTGTHNSRFYRVMRLNSYP